MSAYNETPDKRIRADFALRIGKLFSGYEKKLASLEVEEQFDATMTLVLLQSLLTTCSELMNKKPYDDYFDQQLVQVPALWGLRSDMVVRNTFPEKLTYKLVIDRVRNALSHPTYGDVEHKYPVSGFKNINDFDGNIWGFSFVNSPDIKHEGSVESFDESDRGRKLAVQKLAVRQKEIASASGEQVLELSKKENGKFVICCRGEPYVRIFQMSVPMTALKSLLLGLSNYLAQPTQNCWDGKSITQLVA